MVRIHSPVEVPYDAIRHVGIAIRVIEGAQQHIGILYRIDGREVSLMHLRWHFVFSDEIPDLSYHWIESKIDPRVAMPFAEWLGVLSDRNKEKGAIPYSIEYCGKYFGPAGDFVRNEIGEGLTCATFVLAAFGDYGLPLVVESTWPKKRLSDKSWHKKILKRLERDAPPEHVTAQRPLIGLAARFRPEEVGGAFGLFEGAAVEHSAITPVLNQIREAIRLPENRDKGE